MENPETLVVTLDTQIGDTHAKKKRKKKTTEN